MDGKLQSNVSFWCRKDRKDYNLWAWKRPWTWDGVSEYYWAADCPDCGVKLTRYAMEMAQNDPYYRQSAKRRMEAEKMRIDLLQPGQAGFETHYKTQYENLQKQREVAETEAIKRKEQKIKQYKKVAAKLDFKNDALARKVKEIYLGE